MPKKNKPQTKEEIEQATNAVKRELATAIGKGVVEKDYVIDALHELTGIRTASLRQELAKMEEEAKPKKERREAQEEIEVYEVIRAMCKKFYQDQFGRTQIIIEYNGRDRLVSSHSDLMKNIISKVYYEANDKPASRSVIDSYRQLLDATADVEAEQRNFHNRIAFEDGKLKYCLNNEKEEQVTITTDGWTIEPEENIFRKYSHQIAQVTPIKCSKEYIDLIFWFVPIPKDDRDLFRVSLIDKFIPGYPCPMDDSHGSQGAAKTMTDRFIRRLLDPSKLEVLGMPKDMKELLLIFEQHYFAPFDNVSHLSNEFSDAFCRAISGIAIQSRKLYTDSDVIMMQFFTRASMNGINTMPRLPDLLERTIFRELERIESNKRKPEVLLNKVFDACRPYILGAIFQILSEALVKYDTIKLKNLPRMADFAVWGEAIAQVLGYKPESFIELYEENLEQHIRIGIEGSLTIQVLAAFLSEQVDKKWSGTPTELIGELSKKAFLLGIDTKVRGSGFPHSPDKLGRELRRQKETLNESGIRFVTPTRTTHRHLFFEILSEKKDLFMHNFGIVNDDKVNDGKPLSKDKDDSVDSVVTNYKSRILELLPNLSMTLDFDVVSNVSVKLEEAI